MQSGGIRTEFSDHLLRVVIDRPGHRNAVNLDMMRALSGALDEAEKRECHVAHISAIGEDFSIGRDHEESKATTPQEWVTTAAGAFEALERFSGVSVAEVKGITFGFGCAMATGADICIAARSTRFAFDEVPRGFAPKLVLGKLLGRLSARVLIDLVTTGRAISADEAQIMGIVSQIVDNAALPIASDYLVTTLLRNRWAAVHETKRFIREIADMDPASRKEFAVTNMIATMKK